MTLEDARSVMREVDGKPYGWMKGWGISTIREALRTVEARKPATEDDRLRAERIRNKLSQG